MPLNISSYLAGVGTVIVVMALGFGAGLHMTGMFDDPQGPNKLERRVAEQAVADEAKATAKASVPVEIKTPAVDVKAVDLGVRPGTTTISANAPSVTAPEAPKPAPEPQMATAQRMKQGFALQRPSAQPSSVAPSSQAASTPALQPAAQPIAPTPQIAVAPQPAPPAVVAEDANAKAGEADVEQAKRAVELAQKKTQKKLAADRRRQREARLNAAAEWVRRQPLEFASPPRVVSRYPF